jgi:NADPH:quinone reductase-like Zn-dependent oxidoreductase
MPSNVALWLSAKRSRLEVKPAPYPAPRDNEIVVRNRAVAVNPVDALMQSIGDLVFPWLKYPAIFGSDVAGEVVEIGSAVTRFRVGDRVLGHAAGTDKTRNNAAEGAFQDYPLLLEHMAAPIPDALPYEQAAVLPLGLSTAACGLFQKETIWRYLTPRCRRSRQERAFSSGAVRPASAATRSNSPSPPDTK